MTDDVLRTIRSSISAIDKVYDIEEYRPLSIAIYEQISEQTFEIEYNIDAFVYRQIKNE